MDNKIDEVKIEGKNIYVRWSDKTDFELGDPQIIKQFLSSPEVSSQLFTSNGLKTGKKAIITCFSVKKKKKKVKVKKHNKIDVKLGSAKLSLDTTVSTPAPQEVEVKTTQIELVQTDDISKLKEDASNQTLYPTEFQEFIKSNERALKKQVRKEQIKNKEITKDERINWKELTKDITWTKALEIAKQIQSYGSIDNYVPEGYGFNRDTVDYTQGLPKNFRGIPSGYNPEEALKDLDRYFKLIPSERFGYNSNDEFKRGELLPQPIAANYKKAFKDQYLKNKQELAYSFVVQLYNECHGTDFESDIGSVHGILQQMKDYKNKKKRTYNKIKINFSRDDIEPLLIANKEEMKEIKSYTTKKVGVKGNSIILEIELEKRIIAYQNAVKDMCKEDWFWFISDKIKSKIYEMVEIQDELTSNLNLSGSHEDIMLDLRGQRNRWQQVIKYLKLQKYKVQERFDKIQNPEFFKMNKSVQNKKTYRRRLFLKTYPKLYSSRTGIRGYNLDYDMKRVAGGDWEIDEETGLTKMELREGKPIWMILKENKKKESESEIKKRLENVEKWKNNLIYNAERDLKGKDLENLSSAEKEKASLKTNFNKVMDLSLKAEIRDAAKYLNPLIAKAKKEFKTINSPVVQKLRSLGFDLNNIPKNMKTESINKIGRRVSAVAPIGASEVIGVENVFKKTGIKYEFDASIGKYWRIDLSTGEKLTKKVIDDNGNMVEVVLRAVSSIPTESVQKIDKKKTFRRTKLKVMKVSPELIKNRMIEEYANCVIIATFIQLLVSNTPLDEKYDYYAVTAKVSSMRPRYTRTVKNLDSNGYKVNELRDEFLIGNKNAEKSEDRVFSSSEMWVSWSEYDKGDRKFSDPTRKKKSPMPAFKDVRDEGKIFEEVKGSFKMTYYSYKKTHLPDKDVVRDDWIFTFKGVTFVSGNFDKTLFYKKGDKDSILEIADILNSMTANNGIRKAGFTYTNINKRWEILEYGGYSKDSAVNTGPQYGSMYQHGVTNHHSYQAPKGFIRLTEALWNKWVDSGRIYEDLSTFLNAKKFDVSNINSDLIKELEKYDKTINVDNYDYKNFIKEV